MSAFTLSPAVDANKVFLVRRAQLEGRIDPHQYHHERLSAIAALRQSNQVVPLYQVVKNAKQITTEINQSDIYIGLENIISDTGEYIATVDKQSISSAGVFKKGQVLFPKLRPYLNKVYLAEFDGLCSTEFHIFETDEMDAEFLAIYLRSSLVVNQTRHLMTGNTLPRLQTEDINRLPIPLLPIEQQRHIVDFYNQANQIKQKKEQQAAALLASIDGYLLGELGITLPQQDNRLEKRIFRVSSREVSGARFDPKLYDAVTQGLKQSIKRSFFEQKSLRLLLTQSVAGDWGKDVDDVMDEVGGDYQKCLVIRSTEFDNQFNLKLDGSRAKYRLIDKQKLQKIDIQANDLLIEKSGGSPDQPVGRIALITQEYLDTEPLCYSNFIHKISVDSSVVKPSYLFEFLRTMHSIKLTESMQSQTNGIRNLIMGNFFAQCIVLPPLDKQNEIAIHIQSIRIQAAQLQAEAAQVLNDAKAQVERMILGK